MGMGLLVPWHDDLMAVGVSPFLMAAFLPDKDEAVAPENTRDFRGGEHWEMLAHGSAISRTRTRGEWGMSEGSNQSARASRAFSTASSSVSPALVQPGSSGKTADQRPVVSSCSIKRRMFMPGGYGSAGMISTRKRMEELED